MFRNTAGGVVIDQEQVVSYTFPKEAFIEINGVKIPLGDLKVECFGGKLDNDTQAHFTKVASLLTPDSKEIINSSIYICDNDISGNGYPGPDDFKRYSMQYVTHQSFNVLKEKVNSGKLRPDLLVDLIHFFKCWAEDNRKNLMYKIQSALKSTKEFPKKLSMIYDDRKLGHISHIVLSFDSKGRCELEIDNTLSPALALSADKFQSVCQEHKVIPDKCDERIESDKTPLIQLRRNLQDQKPFSKMRLDRPVNQALADNCYQRMQDMLALVGIKINRVSIRHTRYNQKKTVECVPFAIQNKLDRINSNERAIPVHENPRQLGIRFRAQQAVLSYLLTGLRSIPRMDRADMEYKAEHWYPNFENVCKELDQRSGLLQALAVSPSPAAVDSPPPESKVSVSVVSSSAPQPAPAQAAGVVDVSNSVSPLPPEPTDEYKAKFESLVDALTTEINSYNTKVNARWFKRQSKQRESSIDQINHYMVREKRDGETWENKYNQLQQAVDQQKSNTLADHYSGCFCFFKSFTQSGLVRAYEDGLKKAKVSIKS